MSNQDGYRIHYDVDGLNVSGCMDIPIADEIEAIERFWERARDNFAGSLDKGLILDGEIDITRIEQKTFQICKACGNPMGNLGLIYDECLNDECMLYLRDQRQSKDTFE